MKMVHRLSSRLLLVLVTLFCGLAPAARAADPPVVVAAASDLQFALVEVAAAYERETGRKVQLSFGSSGNFARQIRQQAPFHVFFSADETYVDDLARDGLTRNAGDLYAVGRLVLMVPKGSPLKADGSLADLAAALKDGRVTRFAIANPEHAPYGRRAEEALRHKGLWDALRDKLVLGENVSQAARFTTGGNAQGGIVAYSLALAPQVKDLASFALIPAEWHGALRQKMVLVKGAPSEAEKFYAYANAPPARAILRQFGFLLPGETN